MRKIYSQPFDFVFILSVGLWSTLLAYTINYLIDVGPFSSLYWLLLVVGVDVAHVYSTLFRTYFSSAGLKEYKKPLIVIPIMCFFVSFAVAFHSVSTFWRALVYIAVFHFIKQQVGFVRIYKEAKWSLEELMIYAITLTSIFLWHLSPARIFHWFIKDDFYYLEFLSVSLKKQLYFYSENLLLWTVFFYFVFRIYGFTKNRNFSGYQAFTLVVATFFSWYFGIVRSQSDFIFTMTNVLTHGIPYLAIVWTTQKKEKTYFSELYVFVFMLLVIAFVEEGFWDALIWREHEDLFSGFYFLNSANSAFAKALALALLILPQLSHYILDGFIWKSKGYKRAWLN